MQQGGDRFPSTRQSAIVSLRSENRLERQEAMGRIADSYWKPVYKYLRMKWRKSTDDAADLTQGFFATAIEKGFFRSYDPQKGRFRTFLRTCLDGYVSNEQKAARRIKRGGRVQILPLDFKNAEGEMQSMEIGVSASMEEYFYTEWVRNLLALAVEDLHRFCKSNEKLMHFAIFEQYDLDVGDSTTKPTYSDLAEKFGLTPATVTNYLAFARREFRRIVLEKLRDITSTDDEFRQEAKTLLGIDPP